MKALSQFVVRVFDLVEAEGRTLLAVTRDEARRAQATATNMAMAGACLLLAVVFVIGGYGLIAMGVRGWLAARVDPSLASVLTGLLTIVLAGGCLLLARAVVGKRTP